MASATLESTLMDTLVSRSVSGIDSRCVVSHSGPQEEGFVSPSSLSPSSIEQSCSYLPDTSFNSNYSHFLSEAEGKENSFSGGEVSTEDEETANAENLAFYFKRSAEDSLCSASKKRRKQINPVRMHSADSGEEQGAPLAKEESRDRMQTTPQKDIELLKCSHCYFETSSEDILRNHIIEDHIERIFENKNNDTPFSKQKINENHKDKDNEEYQNQEREEGEMIPLNLSSPRWEQRINSQIRENGEKSPESGVSVSSPFYNIPPFGDSKFGLPGLLPLGPPPFLLPFLQQHQQQNSDRERIPLSHPMRPISNGQNQIFNLEAYCDLCNKEFCNKYFLKTHKANKHGIYSPDICSSQNPSSATSYSPSVSASHIIQNLSTSAVTTPLTVPVLQKSPLNSVPLPGSPFAGAFITANMSALPIRPLISSHFPTISKNTLPMSYTKSDVMGNSSKNGIINIEAYCEICQKEFCNKYFLKRHKSKIHNIDIEVTIKNTARQLHAPKPGFDRPDGWCDACRKDIGSRTRLNTHKLNVHGPHIMMPLTSSHEPGERVGYDAMKNKTDNSSLNISPENFSPWDLKREELIKNSRIENKDELLRSKTSEEISRTEMNAAEQMNYKKSEQAEYQQSTIESISQRESIENTTIKRTWHDIDKTNNININQNVQIENSPDRFNVKEEPRNFPDSSNNENIMHNYQDQISEDNQYIHDKNKQEEKMEEFAFKSKAESEERPNVNVSMDVSDSPRTPGAGSSNDESSREVGQLYRPNHSKIIPHAVGTKYTPEQLRQLGVINPDAFCELCCKEFCNKYFLRTHRIKKHGIYTPEYSDRSKSFKDFTPLPNIFDRKSMESRSCIQEYEEAKCDLCERVFPNLYLMQMHKYYLHGPGQEIFQHDQLLQLQQQAIHNERLRRYPYQTEIQRSESLLQRNRDRDDYEFQNRGNHILQNSQQSLDMKFSENIGSNNSNYRATENLSKVSNDQNDLEKHTDSEENDSSKTLTTGVSKDHLESSKNEDQKSSAQDADTSQGLRKLQSMILELTKQEDGLSRCKLCQKETGNEYILRAHLMTEHGILPQGEMNVSVEQQLTPKTSRDGTPISSPSSNSGLENQGYCVICKKDFFSRYILQQHHLSTHGMFTPSPNPSTFLDRIRAEIESRDDTRSQLTSRSFCEICNKELCNKYFMKTHMLKMHGINIENGTSGGVTCDICKKDLCSKYFLRVHKQNTHGIVDESIENEMNHEDIDIQVCPLCSKRFKNIKWLQTHLNTDHDDIGKEKWKEIECTMANLDLKEPVSPLCNLCGHQFPDIIALQIHGIRMHGVKLGNKDNSMGEKDSNSKYECSLCHVSFPSLTLLYVHEKTHNTNVPPPQRNLMTESQEFTCSLCSRVLSSFEEYHQHNLHHQLEGFLKPLFTEETSPFKALKSLDHTPEKVNEHTLDNCESKSQNNTPRKRWRCYDCGTKFKSRKNCILHVQTRHIPKAKILSLNKSPCKRKLFRCKKCGGVAKSLSVLKSHIRKKHSSSIGMPTSHAQPSITDGQFVMQPFLLNKQGCEGPSTFDDEETFVPSLVYLPVSKKIRRPITVSFSLTPA